MSANGPDSSRRRALEMFVRAAIGLLGSALAAVLGLFALPAAGGARVRWVRAGTLDQLTPGEPHAAVVSVPRDQGWYRARTPDVVFLTWDGGSQVSALAGTCSHLGCRVRWEPHTKRFLCPCHGGAYDAEGAVVAGPPPQPLSPLETKLDGASGVVLVRL